MSKTISVEYFAQSRLIAGTAQETIELDDEADLDGLLAALATRHGEPMSKLLGESGRRRSPGLLIAIGGRLIPAGEPGPLRDGDCVTVLPAISGG